MTINVAKNEWMKLYYSPEEAAECGTITIETTDGNQHLCTDFTMVKSGKLSQEALKVSDCPHDGKFISAKDAVFSLDGLYTQRVNEGINKPIPR